MRGFLGIAAGLIAACALAFGASAQGRVALVIGNGAYGAPLGTLTNPPEDARLVAAALEQVGFDVDLQIDLDQEGMLDALARLHERLAAAGPDPVAVVYYAGHGTEEGGYNYLIPLGADIALARYYRTRAVSADEVLAAMQEGGARLSFLILDACRNNPLPRSLRDGGAGLAAMTPASGTVIAYATAPGNVAADGYGANSPYAAALAQAIVQPGLDYDDMFSLATSLVRVDPAAARYNQIPAYYASREGDDFCFAGCEAGAAPAAPTTDDEMAVWGAVSEQNTAEGYESYLARYESGRYADRARALLAALAPADEPAPPADVDALTREAQELLAAMGYDPGPADGAGGERTRAAAGEFRNALGLPDSGFDASFLMALRTARTVGHRAAGGVASPAVTGPVQGASETVAAATTVSLDDRARAVGIEGSWIASSDTAERDPDFFCSRATHYLIEIVDGRLLMARGADAPRDWEILSVTGNRIGVQFDRTFSIAGDALTMISDGRQTRYLRCS